MYVSGDSNGKYVYAGLLRVSDFTAIRMVLKGSLTLTSEDDDVRYAIRELYHGH